MEELMYWRFSRSACSVFAILSLSACAEFWTALSVKTAGGSDSLITTAEYRTVNHLKREDGIVTCAEPSPDVAKAVASSFDSGAAVTANLPSGVNPEVAFAVSRSQAASIAQLAERLATIQTLRDGLYRACEAYANKAISETTYAAIVSRLDDTLVTLMLGEFAAGAFGRSLAAVGTGADGTASASLDRSENHERSREAEASLNDSMSRRDEIRRQIEQAEATDGGDASGTGGDASGAGGDTTEVAELQRQLQRSSREVETAKDELVRALRAEASSGARAVNVTAAGGITMQQSPAIAETLARMQRNYIDNANHDAVELACLTALSEVNHPLTKACEQRLPSLADGESKELLFIYFDRWLERDPQAIDKLLPILERGFEPSPARTQADVRLTAASVR
jgi:hypothetical protein